MADISKMKLYEEGRVKGIASALRRKMREYYTYPGDNSVDTSANAKKFYEGTYTLADLGPYEGSDSEIKDTRTKTTDGKNYENFGVNNLPTRLGFPSSERIVLSGISSGGIYTVPDNGWICISVGNTNTYFAQVKNNTNGMAIIAYNIYATGHDLRASYRQRELAITMPCARYDKVTIWWSNKLAIGDFFFVKAIETNKCEYNTDGTPKGYSVYKHLAMPIISYDKATPVSVISGQNYTAPSDGWLVWGNTKTDNNYCVLYNNQNTMKAAASNDFGMVHNCFLPVAKGQTIKCTYVGGEIRFLPAYSEDI